MKCKKNNEKKQWKKVKKMEEVREGKREGNRDGNRKEKEDKEILCVDICFPLPTLSLYNLFDSVGSTDQFHGNFSFCESC